MAYLVAHGTGFRIVFGMSAWRAALAVAGVSLGQNRATLLTGRAARQVASFP